MSDGYDWREADKALKAQLQAEVLRDGYCPECEWHDELLVELQWVNEIEPQGSDQATGYEVYICPVCNRVYDRRWVGH